MKTLIINILKWRTVFTLWCSEKLTSRFWTDKILQFRLFVRRFMSVWRRQPFKHFIFFLLKSSIILVFVLATRPAFILYKGFDQFLFDGKTVGQDFHPSFIFSFFYGLSCYSHETSSAFDTASDTRRDFCSIVSDKKYRAPAGVVYFVWI